MCAFESVCMHMHKCIISEYVIIFKIFLMLYLFFTRVCVYGVYIKLYILFIGIAILVLK